MTLNFCSFFVTPAKAGVHAGACATLLKIVCLALFAMAGGCVAGKHPPPDRLAEIKTVGVISAIGDRVTFETIGASVFGNVEVTEPVEWDIDRHVVARITAALAGRYKVVPVNYDRVAFDKIAWADETSVAPGFRDATPRRIEDIVAAAASPPGLDAYVVVSRATSPYARGHQIVRGLGIVRGEGSATYAPAAYALYDLSLIDGPKHTVIGRARASLPSDGAFRLLQGPYREIKASIWAPSLAALAPSRQQQLRETLLDLIDRSLPGALAGVGLIE